MADIYLGTYSGKYVNLADPNPDDIDIIDIVKGLSNLCRFGGQVSRFYSVAEHSVWVSKMVPPEMAMQGLMHDAAEAYLVDLPTPIKRNMPLYYELEGKLHAAIAAKFGFDPGMPDEIKTADARMCSTETLSLQVHIDPEVTARVWGDFFERYPPYKDLYIRPYEHPTTLPSWARKTFLERFTCLLPQT